MGLAMDIFLVSLDIERRNTICLEWFTAQLLSDSHICPICYSSNPHHRHVRHAVTSLAKHVMENTSKTMLELEAC